MFLRVKTIAWMHRILACAGILAALHTLGCAPIPPVDPLGSAQHHTQVGRHFYETGEFPKAEKEFRRALELYPSSEVAAEYLALLLYRADRLLQAEEMAARAIELNPGSGRAYLVLAGCLHRQKKSNEALGAVRRALTLLRRPDERQQAQRLIEDIQAAVDGRSPRRDTFKRALGFFRAEEWDSAAVLLEAIAAESPRDSAAAELVALLRLREYRFDEAVVAANTVLKRHPRSAAAYFVLGTVRRQMNDTLNAVPLLRKATDLAGPGMQALLQKFKDLPPAPADTAAAPEPVLTAVLPLGSIGAAPADSLFPVVRTLLTAALEQTGRFRVVASSRVDSLPALQGSAAGGPIDPETALTAGASLGCGAVLLGGLGVADGVYEADARIIDVTTAQALGAASGSSVGTDGLGTMAATMAARLVEQMR